MKPLLKSLPIQYFLAYFDLKIKVENPPTDNSEGDAPVVNNKPLSSEEDRDDDIEDSVENNQVTIGIKF